MRPKIGNCEKCGGENKIIVNRTHQMCIQCNDARLKEQRSNPKEKKVYVYRRKPTGELALFQSIWKSIKPENRRCIVTGKLITDFDIRCFSHVLSKGAYPRYRKNKRNIVLMLPEIHHQWEFSSRSQLELLPEWQPVFKLHRQLRHDYYTKTSIAGFPQ